ncbi:MAG: bifunctional diaminohydroxyphosphoribosylaminopyrimidine deaminase/5-amino-6-(5-phosphoribosylamino)uracil reductase RibD [Thermoguttaceae bacterium]|nr:bifunctional diaminohydroxyphosphoribosylaminopyrimidine deaminase/5-amino-6-(5-phosphoribosylamino)uracil reductase RibD [Thermoguttaceae bacterium]
MTSKLNWDEHFMRQALALAAQGQGSVEPNPMVGCVLVRPDLPKARSKDDPPKVVGTGYHARFGGDHAEAAALKKAKKQARGATCYVTLEPCCHFGKTPPCCDALIEAGIRRVVTAMTDPFPKVAGGGLAKLRAAGIEVTTGVLEEEARALNAPYLTRVTKRRPWIIGKWAMTLDGKIATRTGASYWVSSDQSRQRVHRLRSRMDAIMVGSRTAMEDDPRLTVRLPEGETPLRTPLRIVFDSGGTLSVFSELALTARDVPLLLAFGPEAAPEKRVFWEGKGAEVLTLQAPEHEQRLILLTEELARRGVTNLLVEGGGELLGHLFDLELLDEIYVFIAPKVIGGSKAVVPVGGFGIDSMRKAARLEECRTEMIGPDVLVSGRLIYRSKDDKTEKKP